MAPGFVKLKTPVNLFSAITIEAGRRSCKMVFELGISTTLSYLIMVRGEEMRENEKYEFMIMQSKLITW